MHDDPTQVLKHISKECVPLDLGGCDKSIQELGGKNIWFIFLFLFKISNIIYYIIFFIEFTKENIIAEKELFLNGLLSLKADMEKKPTDANSNEQSDLFGCDGNFKQLNID